MDYDSLDGPERRLYRDQVYVSHHRRVEFELLRLDGEPVRSIENVMSAAVQGDEARTPREVLELDVYDDDFLFDWKLGQHRHFKVRVIDARFVEALDDWVERIAFTGPLWDFDREGPIVSLVAQGSERLAMGSVKEVFKRPRKAKGDGVIRDLLTLAGALKKHLLIPHLNKRLPERVTVGVERGKDRNPKKDGKQQRKVQVFRAGTRGQEDTYWSAAEPIAEAMDRDLYADARGRFVMATPKSAPSLTVTERQMIGQVLERRGQDGEVTNTWEVFGRNPKGDRPQVHVVAALPDKHPSSAYKMRWNGERRKVIETIENNQLDKEAATALARRKRDKGARETVEREVQLLPVTSWVRPGMLVTAPTPQGKVTIRASRWTVGFTQDSGSVTIGGNRRRGL
jgi:hypothetical protein